MNGILLFNKPILWTSHDAVDFVRRCTGQRSVGHTGTLDPMATGLLVMLLGRATKLQETLTGLDKDYRAVLTLGMSTDTLDLEGRILSEGSWDRIGRADVEAAFQGLTGVQFQTPPIFSAVRVGGKRLYESARRGQVPLEASPRRVTVLELRLENFCPPDVAFFTRCSKGTYVRSLCQSVGEKLGCGAVLSCLVRTRVGDMTLENAFTDRQILDWTPAEIRQHLLPYESLHRVSR